MKRKVVVFTILVALVVGSSLLVISLRNNGSTETEDSGRNISPPLEEGPLNVQLELEKDSYRYGETIRFRSIVQNISDEPRTYKFNTTCIQGILYIDGQTTQGDLGCGEAITEVNVRPEEQLKFNYDFELKQSFSRQIRGEFIDSNGELVVEPGLYRASVEWQNVRSEEITFEVLDPEN